MATLSAVAFSVVGPVPPVGPLPPDVAAGLEMPPALADPVSPRLVAADWLAAPPEDPDVASGWAVTAAEPPPPPPVSEVATLLPPAPVELPPPTLTLITAPPG